MIAGLVGAGAVSLAGRLGDVMGSLFVAAAAF